MLWNTLTVGAREAPEIMSVSRGRSAQVGRSDVQFPTGMGALARARGLDVGGSAHPRPTPRVGPESAHRGPFAVEE